MIINFGKIDNIEENNKEVSDEKVKNERKDFNFILKIKKCLTKNSNAIVLVIDFL